MNGPTTIITDPGSGEEKKFAFDYSYWSFDGFKEEKNGYCAPDSKHPNGKKFCDQVRNKPNITGICSTPNTDLSSLTHYVLYIRIRTLFPACATLVRGKHFFSSIVHKVEKYRVIIQTSRLHQYKRSVLVCGPCTKTQPLLWCQREV